MGRSLNDGMVNKGGINSEPKLPKPEFKPVGQKSSIDLKHEILEAVRQTLDLIYGD